MRCQLIGEWKISRNIMKPNIWVSLGNNLGESLSRC
jgi:hypothetical protein